MSTKLLLLVMIGVLAATNECTAARKFYSRPLKFKYNDDDDQETSATKHKTKHHHDKDESHEESHESEHHEDESHDKGKKDYESNETYREHDEGEKKHSNVNDHERYVKEEKEHSSKELDEHKRVYDRDAGKIAEKGEKYNDRSKYQKGHSTKGEHNIVKKDEFEKKHDFYDEFHDDDSREKHEKHADDHANRKERQEKLTKNDVATVKGDVEKHGEQHRGVHHVRAKIHDVVALIDRNHDRSGNRANKHQLGLGKVWIFRRG